MELLGILLFGAGLVGMVTGIVVFAWDSSKAVEKNHEKSRSKA